MKMWPKEGLYGPRPNIILSEEKDSIETVQQANGVNAIF
jgi:hypothetical protein